jgi:[acyl-carrier-protein] S-malonyltransferase
MSTETEQSDADLPNKPAPPPPPLLLKELASNATIAFRGYNQTNLGRTAELLAHPVYGRVIKPFLVEAGRVYSGATDLPCDLVKRVQEQRETSLEVYGEAVALIVATELAQLKLLEEFFGVKYADFNMAVGYSLGEVSALVAGGVYSMDTVLHPLLSLSKDTAELAADVRMGVLFSRGPAVQIDDVRRLLVKTTAEGNGTISISSFLSPNTLLLMGQHETIRRFKTVMKEELSQRLHLHVNQHYWPPIHTTITRQRHIPDRAAVMLETATGGFVEPSIPILSCVTGGDYYYNDYNSRDLLIRWVDRPQRLWEVIQKVMRKGIETVVHVGPEPNIIPATLNRLAANVTDQLEGNSLASYGLRAMSAIIRQPRPWLTKLLSDDATLLRAPFINQVVLEDWLLASKPE